MPLSTLLAVAHQPLTTRIIGVAYSAQVHLGIEVDDALEMAEQTEVWIVRLVREGSLAGQALSFAACRQTTAETPRRTSLSLLAPSRVELYLKVAFSQDAGVTRPLPNSAHRRGIG